MNIKIKNFALLLIATAAFTFSSCEKDLYEETIQQSHSKTKVETVSLKDIFKRNDFINAYKRIPKKKISKINSLGKTELEEVYGFTIKDAPVKVVLYDGKTTYTLLIDKDGNTDNKLENLILYSEPVNGEIGYIIKYNCDKESFLTEEQIKNSGIYNFEGIVQGNTNTTRFLYVTYWVSHCILHYGDLCYCGGDPNNPHFTSACGHWQDGVIYIPDYDEGSGGGVEPGDNGEIGGTGNNGISTSPVTPRNLAARNYISSLSNPNSPNYTPNRASCYASSTNEFKDAMQTFLNTLDINDDTITSSNEQFANQAIDAVCGGAQVDFPNKVILDLTFINSPKIKCVYDKMISGTNTNFFKQMLQKFNNNTNKTLTFKVDNLPQPNTGLHDWAITDGNSNNPNIYSITTDSNLENQSILQIMGTLCHELIHAYIFDSLQDYGYLSFNQNGNLQFNLSSLNCNYNSSTNFSTLSNQQSFEAILCALNNNNIPTQSWSHDLFNSINFDINLYRTNLEQFLCENHDWDNENLVFKNQMIAIFGVNWKHEVAKAISWIGLESTLDYPSYISSYPANTPKQEFAQNPMLLLTLAKNNCP